MTAPPVLVLDNGAYTIKAGFAATDEEPRIFPNSIARSRVEKRVYVADEIDNCRDLSGIAYRRPFERVGHSPAAICVSAKGSGLTNRAC